MFSNQAYRSVIIWVIVFATVVFFVGSANINQKTLPTTLSYSKALDLLGNAENNKKVVKITIQQDSWIIDIGGEQYKTTGPLSEETLNNLSKNNNIELSFKGAPAPSIWATLLVSWVPTLLIIFLIYYFLTKAMKKSPGNSRMDTFSNSKAKVILPSEDGVGFEDVAGCDEAKSELEELVEFLRNPQKFTRLGGKLPKGVLLHGPPGTGKTLLAKAVANEAQVPFLVSSGSEFVEMFVGVGASRVRDLFDQAHAMAPCIVFIDELDAIGKTRGGKGATGNDEREQTLNQILVEMDGFDDNSGIIILAATNRLEILDKALTRPGRFDRKVAVPLPDANGRKEILKIHFSDSPISEDVDLDVLAATTPGLSGADLANLINEACIMAAMDDSAFVSNNHIELAKDKILMGKPRKSMKLTEESRRATAIHEAGHAILAYYLDDADPLHKVTIIPHGRALGVTIQMPTEDRLSWNKKQNLARIKVLLGGYVAEKMFYGEQGTTTGVSNDLLRAKQIAETMVKDYGMGNVGPVFFGKDDGITHRGADLSEASKAETDLAIKQIMSAALTEAEELLEEKREHIALLTEALMDSDTVMASDLEGLFSIVDIYLE
jgi:cell division protease FtsH